MGYRIKKGGLRLPCIEKPEDVDALTYLTDDQKEYGKRNLTMVPPTAGWLMLGNDPDVQTFWQVMEREYTSLMDGEMQAVPFSFMNLANMVIAKHTKNEYLWGVMAACTSDAIHDYNFGYEGDVKIQMIEYPESSCWSEDERLYIVFVKALIEFNMTDEIFQKSIDSWGESLTLRRISWVCYVYGYAILLDALNMKFDIKTDIFPYGTWTPEAIKMTTDNLSGTKDQIRKLWMEMNNFVSNEKKRG